MVYRVKATIRGQRLTTDYNWKTRSAAENYAEETKKFNRNSRPRIVYSKK